VAGREVVDGGGVHSGVNRACHQRQTARLARILGRRHHRGRRERLDDRLAHRDEMPARTHCAEKVDHVLYVLVDAERALLDWNVTTVVPVRVNTSWSGQHRANRVTQQR
jgi:hypothetical protein